VCYSPGAGGGGAPRSQNDDLEIDAVDDPLPERDA
jgi:hypothetical protein